MTKNVGDVGARSEQGRNIVTVTKNIGDVRAGSEISRSNVTVTKNLGAGRSRVGARSEQNMIHDMISEYMKARHEKASAKTGRSQHHLCGPYQLITQSVDAIHNMQQWKDITDFLGWIESQ